jgi:hypothetical protein
LLCDRLQIRVRKAQEILVTTFHPAFDIKTKTWFVDNFEAPTLAALKRLLPRRAKIKDHYPNGYKATRITLREPRNYVPMPKVSFNTFNKSIPKPLAQAHPTASIDAILDDWAAGMSGDAIADKHGIFDQRKVMKKIKAARDRGDPRADFHNAPHAARPKRYNHDVILNLWAQGLTGPEIGRQLGLHASTTAAAIVAEYRKKGDPRALARAPVRRVVNDC